MAAVEVTITGMLYDKLARTTQNVVLIGEASLTGLGVGGGPMPPGQRPPVPPGTGIWPNPPEGQAPIPSHPIALPGDPWWPTQPPAGGGGPPPKPTFPIWGPPGIELPPGSGYPPWAGHPLPQPPDGGPGEPPKPIPGWEAKAIWTAESGWAVIIVPKEDTLVPTPS